MNDGQFFYVKDRYVKVNHVTFELETFHTLYPNFNIDPATHASYDGKTVVFNDGINQWGGPSPWPIGDVILFRFKDLLMMKKNIEETKDS